MPIEVEGMDELLKMLESTGADVRRAKVKALRRGAKILQDEIIARAKFTKGYSTGNTADHILIQAGKTHGDEMSAFVGPDSDKVPYAKYLEFGSREFRAQPFVEPALLAKKKEIQQAIADSIRQSIERGRV